MEFPTIIAATALTGWLGVILAPWQPWRNRETLPSGDTQSAADALDDVTVLIPARNEAGVIGTTLRTLGGQGRGLRIIVVDDQSTDSTALAVQQSGAAALLLHGSPPPPGWSGKLWALQQGAARIETPLTLLLDADIALAPGVIPRLKQKMLTDRLALVSIMARLRTDSRWERLLMPAFVYFFKLLYPFSLSNSRFSGVAAAAGGCMLLQSRFLQEGQLLQRIHHRLIDDCALAREIKNQGCRIWIGLCAEVNSLRACVGLHAISAMVSRTAFTQLRHSVTLLAVCTAAMLIMFGGPLLWIFPVDAWTRLAALAACILMITSYVPILRFYGISAFSAALLPLTAALYLGMTWISALNHWRGRGAVWKERPYPKSTQ